MPHPLMQLHGQHNQSSYFPAAVDQDLVHHPDLLESPTAEDDHSTPLAPNEASSADISLLGTNSRGPPEVLEEDAHEE